MVIGNGMIANNFSLYRQNEAFLIFASGVSNSKNKLDSEFQREFDLLRRSIEKYATGRRLVYFSTCSIYDPAENSSAYVQHKLRIEEYIKQNVTSFLTVRASNVVGERGNPNTILNYFIYHIRENLNFDVWSNATRNLIDVRDLYKIVDYILRNNLFLNETINVANRISYSVGNIVKQIEKYLNTNANYTNVEKGAKFNIDLSKIEQIIDHLKIDFSDKYLENIIRKNF